MTYTPSSAEEQAYLDAYDPKAFPITMVTVDLILHTDTHVALVKRKGFPYKGCWALPGGFVDQNETTAFAALRELHEEAGLALSESMLKFVGVADEPNRDPRGRTISFVYSAQLPDEWDLYAGDDAKEAKWFAFWQIGAKEIDLAFDHSALITLFLMSEGRNRL